jgi:hypothetical protein
VTVGAEVTLGPPETLFQSSAVNGGYDVSADGQRIVVGASPGGAETETAVVVVQNWFAEFVGE